MNKYIKHLRGNKQVIALTTTQALGGILNSKIPPLLLASLKIKKTELVLAEQVHGTKIAFITKKDKGEEIKGVDGLITKEKRVYLAIKTADCLPIFCFDPQKKIIALIHAGWKSSYQEICQKVIAKLKRLGAKAENIKVHIGPHIETNCYAVSFDLAQKFINKFKTPTVIKQKNDKIYLNLKKVNQLQLLKMGVLSDNITSSNCCTFCNKDFFSYRRDHRVKKAVKEMLSIISLV